MSQNLFVEYLLTVSKHCSRNVLKQFLNISPGTVQEVEHFRICPPQKKKKKKTTTKKQQQQQQKTFFFFFCPLQES